MPVAAAATAALVAAGVAGCSRGASEAPTIEPSAAPSGKATKSLVGPGCTAYVKKYANGPGSPDLLAKLNLAEAIAVSPQLSSFSQAISGRLNRRVSLTRELDGGEFTVFAPTNAAFAKLPKETLTALAGPQSAEALTELLLYHLVVGQRSAADLNGTLKTRSGEPLKIAASGDRIRVGDQANVTCGDIRAANATIYLIDTVLITPADPASSDAPSPGPTATATPSATPTPN